MDFFFKSETSYVLREFSQSYSLPEDLKIDDLKTKWSNGGLLTIEAPLPKLEAHEKEKEKEIKILHHGGTHHHQPSIESSSAGNSTKTKTSGSEKK